MWPVDEMTIFFSGHLWYVGPLIRAIGMPNYQSGPDLGPVSNLCTAMWLHAMTLLHHIPDAERKWSCKTDGKVVDDDDDAYASWVWISLSIQGFYECLVSLGVFPVAQMMQLSAVPRAAISTPDARQWSDTFWLLEFPWRMPKATGKKIFWVIFVTSLKGFGCVFFYYWFLLCIVLADPFDSAFGFILLWRLDFLTCGDSENTQWKDEDFQLLEIANNPKPPKPIYEGRNKLRSGWCMRIHKFTRLPTQVWLAKTFFWRKTYAYAFYRILPKRPWFCASTILPSTQILVLQQIIDQPPSPLDGVYPRIFEPWTKWKQRICGGFK